MVDPNADASAEAAAMPKRVPAKVPHHLVEVTAIESYQRLRGTLDPEQVTLNSLDAAELISESSQELDNLKLLLVRTVSPVEPEHVLHHSV